MDGYLKSNLDIVNNEAIPNKWDSMAIVFGGEGSGKSTLTSQIASYLDPNFSIKDCCFNTTQFDECIEKCKPESSIQWDEAITGTNVAQHANAMQVNIISKLTQIRKKRLKIFLCAPYLNMFNKYFINRCLFGIYVYAKDFDDRGYAYFYSQRKLELLYNLMKDKYRYNYQLAIKKVRSDFWFGFPNKFMLPEKEYDLKKETARKENEKTGLDGTADKFGKFICYANKKYKITHEEIAKQSNCTRQYISQLAKRQEGKQTIS